MIIHNPKISGSILFPADAAGNQVTLQVNDGTFETIQLDSSGDATSTTPHSNLSGSFSGSFIGDGSNLTGIAASSFNIDLLNAGIIDGADNLLFSDTSDSGTEKKGTFVGGLNTVGVISGSSQVTLGDATGTIDLSTQTNFAVGDTTNIDLVLTNDTLTAYIKGGVISGSAQLLNVATDFGSGRVSGDNIGDIGGTTNFTGSFVGDGTSLSGVTSYTDTDTTTHLNSLGVVSGSTQVSYSGITNKPTTISSAQASAITTNTSKNTNVSTDLSISGTSGARTIESSDGDNAIIPIATTSVSGLLSPTLFDEIDVNTAKVGITSTQAGHITANNNKNTNVTTNLSISGTSGARTIASSDGTDAIIPLATTSVSGLLSPGLFDEIDDNTAKTGYTDSLVKTKLDAEAVLSGSITSTDITDVAAFSQSGTYSGLRAQSTTKADVGLGNVTNESKSTMFTSPTLTGTVIVPTPSSNDNSTKAASTAFVQTELTDLIGGAGSAFDTLLEISASIANGDSDVVALTTTVGTKLAKSSNLSDLANASTARTNLGIAGGTSGQFLKHDGTFGTPSYTTNTNTTYSIGDGGLTTNDFTDADHSKLNAIEASADVTDAANVLTSLPGGTVSGSSQITLESTTGNLSGSRIIGDIQASSVEYSNVLSKPTLVSASVQITHDSTTGFVANEHIDHSSITLGSGLGLSGGGTIDTNRSISLDTTSSHFTAGVKTKLNTETVVSGSVQVTHDSTTGFVANEHIDWTADQGATNLHSGNYTDTNTTYSIGDGGLTTNDFTDADHSKLNAIASSATNVTNNNQITNGAGYITSYTNTNTQLSTEQVQDIVGGMFSGNTETRISATYVDGDGTIDLVVNDMTANTTYSVGDGGLTDNNFTDADHSKLNGIEASATADQTAAQIRTLVGTGNNDFVPSIGTSGHFLKHDGTFGLPSYTTNTNTTYSIGDGGLTQKNFTTTLYNKLNGIEASADVTDTTNVKSALNANLGTLTVGDSTDTVSIPGNLTVTGTTTTNNVVTVSTSNGVVFEGNAADANEITLLAGTVTADRTITLPNATGTVALTSDIITNNNQITNGANYITSYTNTQLSTADVRGKISATGNSQYNSSTGVITSTNTTYSVGDGGLTTNNFTDADHSKLNGIEASATADQTAAQIRTLVGTGNNDFVPSIGTAGHFLKHDGTFGLPSYTTNTNTNTQLSQEQVEDFVGGMLGGTETGITVTYQDTTGDIDFVVTSQTDENFTTADHSKLDGIAVSATNVTNNNQITNGAGYITSYTNTNTQLSNEQVQDIVGGMVSGNTESGISVTYDDAGNSLDFSVTSQTDENFTTADHSKLNGIEASATADQTAAQIRTLVGTGNNDFVPSIGTAGHFLKHDGTFGLPSYTTNTNTTYSIGDGGLTTNDFTDADHDKLDGIEASADVTDTSNVVSALTAGTNIAISAGGTISSTDTNTVYTHPTGAGNKHIPSGGASGNFLKYSANGTATWVTPSYTTNTDTNTTYTAGSGISLTGTVFANTSPNIVQTTVSGNAGSATVLQTARTIAGVSFNGSSSISLNNNAITNGAGYITSYINTQLSTESVQDIVGAMFSSNTETRISATYQDGDGTIDLVVNDMTANTNTTTTSDVKSALNANLGTLTLGDSSDEVVIPGDLTVTGTTTTNNVATVSTSNGVIFEGNAADANEVTLLAGTVTADRTITLPNATGTVALTSDIITNNNQISNGAGYITSYTDTNTVYTHPTYNGDDFSVDSGALTGATVISDIDINVTTDSSGHVTDANGTVATRTLTLANLGYSGASNANYYTFPYTVSQSEGASTIAQRTSSGYLHASYFNGSGTFATSGASSGMGNFTGTNGTDTFGRSYSAAGARTLLNVANGATNVTNNNQITNGAGFTTNVGDITGVTAGTFLTGGGTSGTVTLNVTGTEASTGSTLVKRDGSGDINARLFRSEYDSTNASIGYVMTQVDTASNNYMRPSTMAQLRSSLNVANGATSYTSNQATNTTSNVTFGTVSATGDVVAYASSDERLKDNIEVISNPIEKVQQLKGVTWDWNSNADELQHTLPNVGVIAQDVEKVLPQLVIDRDNGFKGVDYAKLTGLLIEAIKEQQIQIEELKSKIS
jgi:predicted secreted Zn-dependent protease